VTGNAKIKNHGRNICAMIIHGLAMPTATPDGNVIFCF